LQAPSPQGLASPTASPNPLWEASPLGDPAPDPRPAQKAGLPHRQPKPLWEASPLGDSPPENPSARGWPATPWMATRRCFSPLPSWWSTSVHRGLLICGPDNHRV